MALAVVLIAAASAAPAQPPAEGATVPDFTLPVLDGGEVTLSERTGAGPTILVFFRGAW